MKIQVPRDRKGEFKPQIVPKYQRNVSGIEDKVISLYARGMSTRDIEEQIRDIYGFSLSAGAFFIFEEKYGNKDL